jgi:drug/metabolite transporter superfamily protein YnfA
MNLVERLVSNPVGALVILAVAAYLEALGDSYMQIGLHRSSGTARILAFAMGAAVLAVYGALVNVPRWDFGRLIGVYVVMFFVMAQILNKIRFGEMPTAPVYAGGTLILAGGLIMVFWQG